MKPVLVCGIVWFVEHKKVERTIVGQGDRKMLDHLLRDVPEDIKPVAAKYFAPLLDGNEPSSGCWYRRRSEEGPIYRTTGWYAWWKSADEV